MRLNPGNLQRLHHLPRAISRFWSASGTAAPPLQVYFLLSDRCNLRCRMCNYWRGNLWPDQKTPMTLEQVRDYFAACGAAGIPTLVLSGGEIFLRPDVDEIVSMALRRFPQVRLQTNGWFLEEHAEHLVREGLQELWVSLDGSRETHDEIRGKEGSHERLSRGLRRVAEWKKRLARRNPAITVHATVTRETVGDVLAVARHAADLGAGMVGFYRAADISPQMAHQTQQILGEPCCTMQFSTGVSDPEGPPVTLSADVRARLRRLARASGVEVNVDPVLIDGARERPVKRCILPWVLMLVSPYGDVLFCHGMDGLRCGSVLDRRPMDIWNAERMAGLRLAAREGLPVCAGCCVPRRDLKDHLRNPETLRRLFPFRG